MSLSSAERTRRWRARHPERVKVLAKKYRHSHRAIYRQQQERRRAQLRREVLLKFGGRCARCGNGDSRVLQLDHVNGGGTQERRSLGVRSMYVKALKSPGQYQLLCANCNWIKRSENEEAARCFVR